MRIVTLGTGAGRPSLRRFSSATALEFDGDIFLFDCGEGTQLQLMRSSLRWSKVKAIFIGHLHGDHFNGLPGLLGTFSMAGRTEPLYLIGPPKLRKILDVLMESRSLWLDYPLELIEIQQPGVVYDSPRFQVTTLPLNHVIDCWGYRFQEKDRPGRFNAQKATALGIPDGPLRAQLIQGKSIVLESGLQVQSSEVIGPARPGMSFAYCLDTRPCESSVELSQGVTCMVHEASFDKNYADEAHDWGHSTAEEAATIAREAKAQHLILTHVSQRYADGNVLKQEAQNIFEKVEVASDLNEFEFQNT